MLIQSTRALIRECALKYANELNRIFRPTPNISITEFCEQNLVLPVEVTAEAGYYRCTKTPYLREVMDCMHPDNPTNKVVFWSGTQLGKTQGLFNIIFYYMANSPCGILFGFSNDGEKIKMVQSRLDPIIKANKFLSDTILSTNNGRSGNTLHLKTFKGGFMTIASAQSPSQFRSMPARVVLLDEVDAYPEDAKGEGDIPSLAEKRTSTFGKRYKMYLSSTTTNKFSKIMSEYNNTDMRKFYVACPKCGHYQLIDWDRFEWKVDGTSVEEVWMNCESCGYHIHDEDKATMLPSGKWIPTNPNKTSANSVGFWLSGLYAPLGWQSWTKCVTEFLEAIHSNKDSKMSTFYNCILAMPYETDKDVPKYDRLYNESKASKYTRGQVPKDVVFLTSGSDIQGNRIETEVVGWTRLGRCKSIETYVFFCDNGTTTHNIESQCYKDYRKEILDGTWTRLDGVIMKTVVNAIDRSYATATINAFWALYNQPRRFMLVKGRDNILDRITQVKEYKPGQGKNDRLKKKNTLNSEIVEKGVFRFIDVGTSVLKGEIYGYLRMEDNVEKNVRSLQEFPNDYDEEYFKQLTAEMPILNPSTKKIKWKVIHTRNEVLDMHVYNYAMWYYLGAQAFTDNVYDELEKAFSTQLKATDLSTRRVKTSKRQILNGGGIY